MGKYVTDKKSSPASAEPLFLLNLYISAFYGFKDPGHCRVVLSPVFLYPLHRLQAELLLRIY